MIGERRAKALKLGVKTVEAGARKRLFSIPLSPSWPCPCAILTFEAKKTFLSSKPRPHVRVRRQPWAAA